MEHEIGGFGGVGRPKIDRSFLWHYPTPDRSAWHYTALGFVLRIAVQRDLPVFENIKICLGYSHFPANASNRFSRSGRKQPPRQPSRGELT
jgi:hypothetical protein